MEATFTTRWFYYHLTGDVVRFGSHTCLVCGLPAESVLPRGKVLRSTFSDYDVLRVRDGQDVCPACAWYMSNQQLRRSGWWLTNSQARPMAKADWLALLTGHIQDPPAEDGYYLVKPVGLVGKHLALLAPLNLAGNTVRRVQFDRVTLDLSEEWLELVEASHRLREYHSWREILSDDYISRFVTERWADLAEFVRLRQVVKPWLRTAHLRLAVFVWNKPGEEGKDEADR